MSENVSHTGVCDDVLRLALWHGGIPDDFKRVFRDHWDVARLGTVTWTTDPWNAYLLLALREQWAAHGGDHAAAGGTGEGGMRVSEKLAYVLGVLPHRAADRLMKPLFQYCREQYGYETGRECTITCDGMVLERVYAGGAGGALGEGPAEAVAGTGSLDLPVGRANPYTPAVFHAPESEEGRRFEAYFQTLFQRAMLDAQLPPAGGAGTVEGLRERLANAQDFYIDLGTYQQVVERPDAEKVRRYIDETHAYDGADAAIRVARRIQAGERPVVGEVEAALAATGEASSRHARALKKGIEYLLDAGRLWRGEIGPDETNLRLDLWVPERSIVFVPGAAGTAGATGASVSGVNGTHAGANGRAA